MKKLTSSKNKEKENLVGEGNDDFIFIPFRFFMVI